MTIETYRLQMNNRTIDLVFDLDPHAFYSDSVLAACFKHRMLPESEVVNALPSLIQPGNTVIDAGANVGFFTVLMSKLVGKTGGLVIAVEPDPRNVEKLQRNLELNDCRNVTIETRPLAKSNMTRDFFIQGENGSSSMWQPPKDTAGDLIEIQKRPGVTLTTLIGDRQPTFMKMDIEGAEHEAITACNYKIPFVICELNADALARAHTSIENLRFHMESVWGHYAHMLDDRGSMPARLNPRQKIVTTAPNRNILFAREWAVIQAWPEVRI